MDKETENRIQAKVDEMFKYMSPETTQWLITRVDCVNAMYGQGDKRVRRTLRKICR